MNTRNRRAFSSASDFFEKYETVGLYQSISNVLEHIDAFSPGRVEDILEACGAFDLGSSPSRDVAVFFVLYNSFRCYVMSVSSAKIDRSFIRFADFYLVFL